ncbi:MAG: UDP-N-acetylmuramate dehydrogenase [Firmicutes bacterium]|nr:UDP-N-acetylmuramate dehydrogenase [Bacillota bacterium]
MDKIIKELEKLNIGKIEKDVFLSKYTTYRTGGLAKCIVYPKDVECLVTVIKTLKKHGVKYKILGNGSNVLFSDKVYEGVLIKLNELNSVEFFGTKVRVGAGFPLVKLSLMAAKKSLTGLEFASGIPGTVGGAIYMNAGAYKSDMGYVVQQVTVLTPKEKIITLENREMDFHYRTSFLKTHPGYICLEVIIKLEKGERSAIEAVIKDRRKRRRESQPLEYPSAGSVFRNPPDMFAGQLIEQLGLKGLKKGGAMVSEKHANFIINKDNASSSDIKYLIDYVKQRVLEEYNVELKVEQEFVNWE